MIDGVCLRPLKIIPDDRGAIYHMLRSDDPWFGRFGEVYFSKVYPMKIKGWHCHDKITLNYAVIFGRIKLVLYDNRTESRTKGEIFETELGIDNYQLATIPPGVWTGYVGLGFPLSLVANCASDPHDPDEMQRLDPFSKKIPYTWPKGASGR